VDQLPLWFLILALFLPRVTLIAGYCLNDLRAFYLEGFIPPALTIFLPRVLIIMLIYQDRGLSPWLIAHGVVMAAVYFGTASHVLW
jgi:hypothetical protein